MESRPVRGVAAAGVTLLPPVVAWSCERTRVTRYHPELGWYWSCASERSAPVSGSVGSAEAAVQVERKLWMESRTLLGSLLDGRTSG